MWWHIGRIEVFLLWVFAVGMQILVLWQMQCLRACGVLLIPGAMFVPTLRTWFMREHAALEERRRIERVRAELGRILETLECDKTLDIDTRLALLQEGWQLLEETRAAHGKEDWWRNQSAVLHENLMMFVITVLISLDMEKQILGIIKDTTCTSVSSEDDRLLLVNLGMQDAANDPAAMFSALSSAIRKIKESILSQDPEPDRLFGACAEAMKLLPRHAP
jgi:hypothetical protein